MPFEAAMAMSHRKVTLSFLAMCGLALPVSAQAGGPTVMDAPGLIATLSRTACFGTCPVYTITVASDGTVAYEGVEFVKIKGKRTAVLSKEDLSKLAAVFEKAGYRTMKSEYLHHNRTDSPTVVTSWRWGGRSKIITHYHGDTSAPKSLSALEDDLDRILHSEQWIGTDAEREELARQHPGRQGWLGPGPGGQVG